MQDLVAVRVADARDQTLVAQRALDLAPLALEHPGEGGTVEVVGERVGSEPRHAGHLGRIPDDVHGEPLGGPGLRQVEAAAPGQYRPQGQRSFAGAGRLRGELVLPLEPARAGEMGDEVKAARGDVEPLAVPLNGGDFRSLDGGERRVVGLEHADGHRQHTFDPPAHQLGVEELP
jgi:hypothetical protein